MTTRKLSYPDNSQAARQPQMGDIERFDDVFEDPPSTQIGQNQLAKAINCIPKGNIVEPRNGSRLHGSAFPAIDERRFEATKVGNVVTITGATFTKDDITNLIVWDNGLTDQIIAYQTNQRVLVRDSDANQGLNCHIQGPLNCMAWHEGLNKWLWQIGQDFYISEYSCDSYSKVRIISTNIPMNSFSDYTELDDFIILNNPGGMFKIDMKNSPHEAININSPIPTVHIQSTDEGDKKYQYRYIYSVAKHTNGNNFIDRESDGVLIQSESGTVKVNDDQQDWAVIDTDMPIGPGTDTYGAITSSDLGSNADASQWTETDGTFRININGLGLTEVVCDFTTAKSGTMEDVATVIESALKIPFPSATCDYFTDGNKLYLKITSGLVANGSVSYVQPGITGTDISARLGMVSGSGTLANPAINSGKIIRTLNAPIVTGSTREQQWNKFSIYRTPDVGPFGENTDENGDVVPNSPDQYIWVKDLRIAGAFYARRNRGTIQALYGEFEESDIGSVIEFDDGTRLEITSFIDSQNVGYTENRYYDQSSGYMAAAIGNGRVIRFSQDNDIVTRTHGSTFSSSDLRKPVWFADGYRAYITEVISTNQVRVSLSRTLVTTGLTIDPVSRNFNDTISDEQLFARASAWQCKNRFFTEMQRGNIIAQQPGYLMSVARDQKELNYCQLEDLYRPFAGYHLRTYQKITFTKPIQTIWDFPDRFSVLCRGEIRTGVVGNAQSFTIPGTLQTIFILSSMQKIAGFGISNWGSVAEIDDNWVRLITDDEEIKDFNGWEFSPNLIEDSVTHMGRMNKALQKAHPQFLAIRSKFNGFLVWWRDK